MMASPSSVPSDCPGTSSGEAGKAAPCQGCPNQKICSSEKPQEPDPDMEIIKKRLENIKHIIVVFSGKGGVGKSTMVSLLARAFAEDLSNNVGVVDVDICGPSLPVILGVQGEPVHISGSGWSPVSVDENLSVISISFIIPSKNDAIIWKGTKKNGLIKQFLKEVNWGDLDYLIIDTPPGTSDEHLTVVEVLKDIAFDGAIIVTTPQEIALLDVRKEITFCRKVDFPILGVVENMSHFVCPKCKVPSDIFIPNTGGAEKMANEMNVPFLGSMPLDPTIARACDRGKSILAGEPDSPAVVAARNLVKSIVSKMEERQLEIEKEKAKKEEERAKEEDQNEGSENKSSSNKKQNTSEEKELGSDEEVDEKDRKVCIMCIREDEEKKKKEEERKKKEEEKKKKEEEKKKKEEEKRKEEEEKKKAEEEKRKAEEGNQKEECAAEEECKNENSAKDTKENEECKVDENSAKDEKENKECKEDEKSANGEKEKGEECTNDDSAKGEMKEKDCAKGEIDEKDCTNGEICEKDFSNGEINEKDCANGGKEEVDEKLCKNAEKECTNDIKSNE